MTGDTLLRELISRSLLTEGAGEKLRRESLLAGKSPEELLHDQRLVPDETIAELKSQLFKVPYEKVNVASLDEKTLTRIPEETARTYGVVPLSEDKGPLVAGMLHPDDPKAQEALRFIAQRDRVSLGVYVISWGDWQDVLKKYSPFKGSIEAAVKSLGIKPGVGTGRKTVRLDDGLASGEEAPVIKIVSDTLREAVKSRASDIHIEPQENYLRIRFRIDGELHEAAMLPAELIQALVSRVKVMAQLKIDETRIPQDGRFRTRVFDRDIDFRVATFPTPLGEKVAIRVLDPVTGVKNFDELGLSPANARMVEDGLDKPFGMILITGPTGSGKTTTLYAFLQKLNRENVNIVSLEDPVEYFVGGVNQSQVRPEIGYDFASGLRQILRQDPDVIMVGEIRDEETAALGVQAALTGHIVLSTLHTNNAVSVIPRLLDMRVAPFLLPVAVNLMISQRLVGLLCASCKAPEAASPALQKVIARDLADAPDAIKEKYKPPYKVYRAAGCPVCKGKGIMGRIAIFEVLKMSKRLEEITTSAPALSKITEEAKAQGMMTLRQDGIVKALDGFVSLEEVLKTTEEV